MQMKNADGNENIQQKSRAWKSSFLIRLERGAYEKVFHKLWEREEDGFNIVMSNLKFIHNKSGFHNFLSNSDEEKSFAY